MVADLEDVLAIETARSGQATGEATSVLKTIPAPARSRVPLRVRNPARLAAVVAVIAVIAAVAIILAIDRTHSGTGAPLGLHSEAGLTPVSLSQNAAHDYNPFGTEPENPNRVGNVIDGDPNTVWTTATYYEGTLHKAGGVGVGIYLDAAPGVVGRVIEIQTPTIGFAAEVYAANNIDLEFPYTDSTPLSARGWHGPFAQDSYVRSGDRLRLSDGGAKYRYYLVWLTTLPAHMKSASISELTLFK